MGAYDTKALPIYTYLHSAGHPRYVIADDFFQAAFGGSFLNHQWLIAAASPTYPNAPANLHSIIDSNGMPVKYPLYNADRARAARAAHRRLPVAGCEPRVRRLRGQHDAADAAAVRHLRREAAAADRTRRSATGCRAKGVDWAWYAGGWSNAARRHERAGLDERRRAELLRPERHPGLEVPELPGRAVPVPSPAVQLLRELRTRNARRDAPARRGRSSSSASAAPRRRAG